MVTFWLPPEMLDVGACESFALPPAMVEVVPLELLLPPPETCEKAPEDSLRSRLARLRRQPGNQLARQSDWQPHSVGQAHSAALIDACNARSDDRSAFTSSTRIPSNGSFSASPSPSTSI